MPSVDILTGVSQVSVSQDDPTVIPSLSGVTTAVSVITADSLLLNSAHKPLDPADSYKITLALVGRDVERQGYTIGIAEALSATQTVVNPNDVILVRIDTADFPVGTDKAIAVAVFLQINAADPQLCGFAQIDGAQDFVHAITSKPLSRAHKVPIGTLTAATATKTLGSRNAEGVTYLPFTPTTGGVRLNHRTSRITVRPDDAPDFDVVTSRATDIQFSVLSGDNESIIQAIGGNYVKFDDGGDTFELSESDLITAIAKLRGNRSILVDMPEDSVGKFTRRLYLGNVDSNFSDITELTSKTEQFQIDFLLQAAPLDYLTRNLHGTTWKSVYN